MKKALVTGGAGFIGSSVVELLLKEGWQVTVFDNFSTGNKENLAAVWDDIEVIVGDIVDSSDLTAACRGVDCIFHLAAHVSVRESLKSPLKTHDNNVIGTENVYNAALMAGVKKIVFSSSCAVYPTPLSPYAESKLFGERLARQYYEDHGIVSVCLRYFNVYGPKQSADSEYAAAVPKFIAIAKSNKDVTIFGDGTQTRDFIHVDDVAKANILAEKETVFSIQNVRTGEYTSVNVLWYVIRGATNSTSEKTHIPRTEGEVVHVIEEQFDYKMPQFTKISLVDGIKYTISGHRDSAATVPVS